MTVSSTSSRVVYVGNGSTTNWPFAFKVQEAADLAVVYTDLAGTDFPLSPSQYSVSGLGLDAGGSVTYPVAGAPIAVGTKLTIYRNVALTQPSAISNQGAMWPNVIEAALDRLTYMAQAVSDGLSRALVISPTDSQALDVLPDATTRAHSVLGFDGSGQPYAATLTGSIVSVATWLKDNFLPVGTTQANARTALGAAGLVDDNTFTGINDLSGGRAKVPTRAAGDNGTDAASTAFATAVAQSTVGGPVLRSYLAGLTLSTAGSSATMGVAAGVAADSTSASMMAIAAFTKTTSAWVAGTGLGGIDTGAVANNTWYHWYLIQHPTTKVTDITFSLSATTPALAGGYTLYRRIGSMKTNGSAQWVAFIQDGDLFQWKTHVADVSVLSPGTAAVTRTLTVPTGIRVLARVQNVTQNLSNSAYVYTHLSDPLATDTAPSSSFTDVSGGLNDGGGSSGAGGRMEVWTNTSAQIRSRISYSDGSVSQFINTMGWIDRRGRDG